MITRIVSAVIAVLIMSSCSGVPIVPAAPNSSPSIEEMSSATDSLAGMENEIICRAGDPDGDPLSYDWSANGGQIVEIGSTARWISPDTIGSYTVSVKVKDGKGGEAVRSVSIRVLNNADGTTALPITLNMRILSANIVSENVTVKVGTTTKVTCTLDNGANKRISYLWSASGGQMKGKGLEDRTCATVYWTAPPETRVYTLSVTARDSDGNEALGRVIFDVFCCPRN